jgi:hypothetical protein
MSNASSSATLASDMSMTSGEEAFQPEMYSSQVATMQQDINNLHER